MGFGCVWVGIVLLVGFLIMWLLLVFADCLVLLFGFGLAVCCYLVYMLRLWGLCSALSWWIADCVLWLLVAMVLCFLVWFVDDVCGWLAVFSCLIVSAVGVLYVFGLTLLLVCCCL